MPKEHERCVEMCSVLNCSWITVWWAILEYSGSKHWWVQSDIAIESWNPLGHGLVNCMPQSFTLHIKIIKLAKITAW